MTSVPALEGRVPPAHGEHVHSCRVHSTGLDFPSSRACLCPPHCLHSRVPGGKRPPCPLHCPRHPHLPVPPLPSLPLSSHPDNIQPRLNCPFVSSLRDLQLLGLCPVTTVATKAPASSRPCVGCGVLRRQRLLPTPGSQHRGVPTPVDPSARCPPPSRRSVLH